MAMDFDAQLIESVEVRRNRLASALLFGANPTERRWRERTRVLVYGVAAAAEFYYGKDLDELALDEMAMEGLGRPGDLDDFVFTGTPGDSLIAKPP